MIADEAHRTQYDLIDGLARNVRDALPNASFMGFTGTPIEADDRDTRSIFGEYIDVYDINDVLWAICSRSDPVDAVEIIRRAWSGPLDPIIPKERKGFSSRMIIDACRPFEWRDKFPPAAQISRDLQDSLLIKWKKELFS